MDLQKPVCRRISFFWKSVGSAWTAVRTAALKDIVFIVAILRFKFNLFLNFFKIKIKFWFFFDIDDKSAVEMFCVDEQNSKLDVRLFFWSRSQCVGKSRSFMTRSQSFVSDTNLIDETDWMGGSTTSLVKLSQKRN